MIKNIILDFSGVVLDFDFKRFLVSKGFDKETMIRIIKASVKSATWEKGEKGYLSQKDALDQFVINDPGIEKELHETFDHIDGMFQLYPYTDEMIKLVKDSGYRIYYLSNFTVAAHERCERDFSLCEKFDGGCLSYLTHHMKPEKEAYDALISKYDLVPSECAFFDDLSENVDAAKNIGMSGFTFTTYEEFKTVLHSFKG